jgi:NAD(P)-dependent dehydrogenase (short-subunit alcohol dehydrogenase family)
MWPTSQKLKINGRVTLITGAANGIGRAVARNIRKKGGIPVWVDLPSESLDSLQSFRELKPNQD